VGTQIVADLYAILQVQPTADSDVVGAAYRALARHYHPDLGGDERAMMALNSAWEVLGDPARRAAYDAGRRRAAAERAQQGAAPPHRSQAPEHHAAPAATPAPQPRRQPADPAVLDFGRYEGQSIAQVARADPDYLLWLVRTPAGRRYSREVSDRLEALRVPAAPRAGRPNRRWAALDLRR
jgi:curved DNA-binding protein CbpA